MAQARTKFALATAVAASLTASGLLVAPSAAGASISTGVKAHPSGGHHQVERLVRKVEPGGVIQHLRRLQRIADHNDGTRASGTPGFDKSADYVAHKMRRAGYHVTRQPFEFPYFEDLGSSFAQTAPAAVTYVAEETYSLMSFSGSGDVTGAVVPVDVSLTPPRDSSSGCEAEDFTGLDLTGKVALMQRGTCAFGDKVMNAEAAGAAAAIVFNQGNGTPTENPDRYELFAGTLGGPVGIPAVSVSFELGEEFATTAGLTVHMTAETVSENRMTENVFAETKKGNKHNVVVVGAHLDSVPEGPGMNDNGSGSAGLLEIAQEMQGMKVRNQVRFAWWGAEEAGLLGSTYYVENLTEDQLADIALYLNFDMIGSPNYMFAIYDGDDSDVDGAGPGPEGSAGIEQVFEQFFDARGIPHEGTDFDGRSDYGPFIDFGIPAGGLFTGAEGIKTAEQAALYGGVEGAAFDPCYHQACDSMTPVADGADADLYAALDHSSWRRSLVGNNSVRALEVNSKAAAAATMTFALSTKAVNGHH